ncbi:hypothetical protein [Flavivirga rizhaonensis]|uniref:Uncharacterized protein n=1 Tax=Flavivirga rizhaonensis TaxID=2559571 RepID=A0A4S1DT46_9FLAO|nr:hypothetical protein [Flavivirga rizhaonensis]TGV00542.1 hypothetical protein EM932_19265 [Flavivirga rizhaonensis]
MKKLYYFLLFTFIGTNSFSQDIEKLPTIPWEELVEMNINKKVPIRKWGNNVNISLEGVYNASDSLIIAKVIKKLDSLTETTLIRFASSDNSNFEIKFLDRYVKQKYSNYNSITNSKNTYNNYNVLTSAELYVYTIERTDLEVKNALENQIAGMLIDGWFARPAAFEKRKSIFNPVGGSLLTGSLNSGDISIIREVYKNGFEKRLEKAEQQFKDIPKKLENDKIRVRYSSFWWVKNPIAVIFLPALILVLFFIFLTSKIKNTIHVKIERD